MQPDKLTTAAQQALATAQQSAMGKQHPEVGGLHLLGALIGEKGGSVGSILAKAGADVARLGQIVESELGGSPRPARGRGRLGGRSWSCSPRLRSSERG